MNKTYVSKDLTLPEVRQILLDSLKLPKNCKLKFKTSLRSDPKADWRDLGFIFSVLAIEAKWKQGKNKASLTIPINEISKIIAASWEFKDPTVTYKTKQIQDKHADIRDPNWMTVVCGVKLAVTIP